MMMDIRILAPRPLGEKLAHALGVRVYETRGRRDEVRVYVPRATADDLRRLADAAEGGEA